MCRLEALHHAVRVRVGQRFQPATVLFAGIHYSNNNSINTMASASTNTISLPASIGQPGSTIAGTLNCVSLAPRIGTAKRFRHLARKTAEANQEFNVAVDRLSAATAAFAEADPTAPEAPALKKAVDDVQAELDSMDDVTYKAITDQLESAYRPVSFTPGDGSKWDGDIPSYDCVTWDDCDISQIRSAIGFFAQLSNS